MCVLESLLPSSQFVVRMVSCSLFLSQEVSEVVVGEKYPSRSLHKKCPRDFRFGE